MMKLHNGIHIDFDRDRLFDELGYKRLKESYMLEEETSPQERFAFVSQQFSSNLAHAQRLYEYASKHWLSYSTPILSFGRSQKGLPISCFLNFIDDSAEGLVDALSETNWLSMLGGGVGIHLGIRAADSKSTGIMPHLKIYDASSLAYRQGNTRRGSYAAYLDINHPDIIQFLEMRKPTGDQNMRCTNLHHGINVTDDFMSIIERCMLQPNTDDSWHLRDAKTGAIRETVSAKALWQRIIEMRIQTGEPYLCFIDSANHALPQHLKNLGLKINGSNLCTEIFLPTNKERTAVCCLSSLNLEYFEDWKTNQLFIKDVAEMLDNVLQYFIDNAPDAISRAKFSAQQERSIGVGALGFHAYLQKSGVPFESALAKSINIKLFKHIKEKMDAANVELAQARGSCPDAEKAGLTLRFSHTTSIAPNASSSLIMGNTSPSIEPYRANVFRQDTLSGASVYKNRFLEKILNKKCDELQIDIDEVWASIIAHDGSVSHLAWLDQATKDIYKTAVEIDQRWIIELAGDRQAFIDQGQSVNVFFRPDVHIKYLHAIHFQAWKKGLKSLYYCRSDKLRKADRVGQQIVREKIEEAIDLHKLIENDECLACQ
jgi:ribonucleoside-diphosphate reductase alpha chain